MRIYGPSGNGFRTQPALTVVVPAHNEAGTITAQLSALEAQEWSQPWELVVVDNRSTDGTAEVVETYAAQHNLQLRVVRAPAKAGISYARNVGIANAAADAVAICDADDVVAPGWVRAMGTALANQELVTGVMELDRLNPPWLAALRGRGDERGVPRYYGVFPYPRGGNMGVSVSLWRMIGGFDEGLPNGAEDVDFGLRAWRAGAELSPCPDAQIHYRYRDSWRHLWDQGVTYGVSRPMIRRMLLTAGEPAPPWFAGWRSWAWLLASPATARSVAGRHAVCWVAANRYGHVVGSIKHRCVLL